MQQRYSQREGIYQGNGRADASERISVAPMRPTGKFGGKFNQNLPQDINSDLSGIMSFDRKSLVDAFIIPNLRTIKFNNFNFVLRGIPDNTIDN